MTTRAIILAGGRSQRFGSVHKPGVELGGRAVVSRILAAIRDADPAAEVWVAGSSDGLTSAEAESVHTVREEPAFAGPLAGIAAAVEAMGDGRGTGVVADSETGGGVAGRIGEAAGDATTLIIAGDMPMVTADHLGELIAESRRTGSPVAGTDDRGKAQFLCAAWPHRLLVERLSGVGDPTNKAVRLLFAEDEPVVIAVDADVVADFDTTDELTRLRDRVDRG